MGGDTLLIGYGNSLRGDDAAGPRIAAAVARWRLPSVRVLIAHQLTPELAADLGEASRAVFIDAAPAAGLPAAALRPLAALPPAERPSPLGHAASPAELLALTRALYGRAPESWWGLVPAEDFRVGAPLSPRARQGARRLLRALRRLLTTLPEAGPVPDDASRSSQTSTGTRH
ncbi:MAG: hydrogenase maturation protease [Candidatus Methylomirabilota bacterium]